MGEAENTDFIVKKHIEKADHNIEVAVKLLSDGFYVDSISKSYYSVYHAFKGLLYKLGETSKTHKGLNYQIYRYFVETEKISKNLHKRISNLLNWRMEADYDIINTFEESDAEKALKTARQSLEYVKDTLNT